MSEFIESTPKKDGFHMPGEFEPHAGCWMLWPERTDNWRCGAKPAQEAFAAVACAIADFEPVTVCVSGRQYENCRGRLPGQIRVVEMSSDDAWMRDCGPTFVSDGKGRVRGVDWGFNAWGGLSGGLYFPWDEDSRVARKVCDMERIDFYRPPLVLEGGSIHVDGEGTCITTAECLLNKNRNPNLSKEEIENCLREYLGVRKIIWIPRGVYNDETDGHVDNLLCFARPGEVILTWTDDWRDPQYAVSEEAYRVLTEATDAMGRSLTVHRLRQPGPVFITGEESRGVDAVQGTLPRREGDRLAASYVNHYIANGGVVVPLLDERYDEQALEQLSGIYQGRRVVGVRAREILLGGGNIHCITQQQPEGAAR